MSKTTPVRWWRDDATRYDDRPLVGVCRSWTQPTLEWTYEPPSPERQAELERLSAWIAERQAEFWRSMMLPAEPLDAPNGGILGAGAALNEYWRQLGAGKP